MADEVHTPIGVDDKKPLPALDHGVVAEAGDTELLGELLPREHLRMATDWSIAD